MPGGGGKNCPQIFLLRLTKKMSPITCNETPQVSNKGIFYVYTYAVRKLHVKLYTPLTCWYVLKIQYVC